MLSIVALASFAYIPPPVPPPEPERMAAAMALWEARPISDAHLQANLRTAASHISTEALTRATKSATGYSLDWQSALVERLQHRAMQMPQAFRMSATQCLATGLAYDLTLEQLKDLHAFILTPSGGAFWRFYTYQRPLVECLKVELRSSVGKDMDEEIKAARPVR